MSAHALWLTSRCYCLLIHSMRQQLSCALYCSDSAHNLPHPFCQGESCHALADVMFEGSPLLAVLDSCDWTALAACSRHFRNLIHSLVKAATVTSLIEAQAILSGHWPKLPLTQPESFCMPLSSELQVLASLTMSSFDMTFHSQYAMAVLVGHRAQQLDDQLRSLTAAFPHLHNPAWQQARSLIVSICSDAICQSAHVLAHLTRLCLPELVYLRVKDSKLGFAAAEHLARGSWPQLEQLDLSNGQLDEAALKALCQGDWPSMSHLLLNNNLLLNAAAIAHIPTAASWSLMTCLELDCVQLDSASLHTFAQMHLHLQILSLCSCGPSDIIDIKQKKGSSKALIFCNTLLATKNNVDDLFSDITFGDVRKLINERIKCFFKSLGAVAASDFYQKPWPCLINLRLSRNNLGADTVASLTRLVIPNIQRLILSNNNLGTDAAEWLAKSSWHQLYSLLLDNNQFDNAAMACLARAQWPILTLPCLCDNAISADGVEFLTKGVWPGFSSLLLSNTAIGSSTWALLSLAADAMPKRSSLPCHCSAQRDLSAQEGSIIWPQLESVEFYGQLLSNFTH